MKWFRIATYSVVIIALAWSIAIASETKPGGKLSFRLEALSKSPLIKTMGVEDQAAALSVAPEGPGSLRRNAQGKLLVYIRMADLSDGSLQELTRLGAEIVHRSAAYQVVTAYVDIAALSALEGLPMVESVQEQLRPAHSSNSTARTRAIVSLSTCPVGVSLSEGYTQLNVNLARSNFGLYGTGVKVGVLSDSFNNAASPVTTAAADVLSGDLPGAANTCGYTTDVSVLAEDPNTGEDEGRAMLQLVHDLAPAATLSFASAEYGILGFADNIRSLQGAGANIVVDDITYYEEPFFQEGPINVAITDVVTAGALYFTSAGNANVTIGGHDVSSYEAPHYRPTACPAGLPSWAGQDCHNFDPGGGTNNGSGLTLANNKAVNVSFQWNEPWYGLSNDFDIYLLDDSNVVVAYSAYDNFTATFQSPFEYFSYTNTTGSSQHYRIVINRYSGSGTPRLKYTFMQNGSTGITNVQYNTSSSGDIVGPSLIGHSSTRDGFSVAAVPYNDSSTPEYYTSRGPATHYFGPVIDTTPAAAISPDLIQQPDFAATDGGCTTFFGGFSSGCYRFYGTSAATPHAAAVAALLKQKANLMAVPLTRGDTKYLLQSTAQTVSGGDLNSVGAGLIDALSAVTRLAGATYYSFPVIRVTGAGAYLGQHSTIQGAYNSSSGGNIIEIQGGTYSEALSLGSALSVTLKGGFDSGLFLGRFSSTVVTGSGGLPPLTIGGGTGSVTVDGIVLL